MKIFFICGSLNQTTMMHKISSHLEDYECFFSPYYADGLIKILAENSFLDNTILGGRHFQDTNKYLQENDLEIDYRGSKQEYDLVITGSDAIVQKNIRKKRLVLIQEGITEPEGILFHIVRALKLPRWIANTSLTGLSHAYDAFCVASQGYKDVFTKKGVAPEKIIVTGIPNFDDLTNINDNNFPYKNHILVATTPYRETMRFENRPRFIRKCLSIADGRQIIFKLHPLENTIRAIREINHYAPNALVYWRGNVKEMMLHAVIVITQQSSCTFTALALGKEVYSNLDIGKLKKIMPIQNEGKSAFRIASVCKSIINTPMSVIEQRRTMYGAKSFWDQIKI